MLSGGKEGHNHHFPSSDTNHFRVLHGACERPLPLHGRGKRRAVQPSEQDVRRLRRRPLGGGHALRPALRRLRLPPLRSRPRSDAQGPRPGLGGRGLGHPRPPAHGWRRRRRRCSAKLPGVGRRGLGARGRGPVDRGPLARRCQGLGHNYGCAAVVAAVTPLFLLCGFFCIPPFCLCVKKPTTGAPPSRNARTLAHWHALAHSRTHALTQKIKTWAQVVRTDPWSAAELAAVRRAGGNERVNGLFERHVPAHWARPPG